MSFNWLPQLCFVAVFVCAITTIVVQCMIVRAINKKRDEPEAIDDEAITGIAYIFGGLFGIFKTEPLYLDYYPFGKLVWLCWIFRVLTIVFVVASVYFR